MSITGLNHLTLAVSNLDRSVVFYSELLNFSLRMRGPLPEYSHIAFSVAASALPLLADKLAGAGVTRWQEPDNADSFYFLDPDGHKLELHCGDIHCRLAARAALCEPGVAIND